MQRHFFIKTLCPPQSTPTYVTFKKVQHHTPNQKIHRPKQLSQIYEPITYINQTVSPNQYKPSLQTKLNKSQIFIKKTHNSQHTTPNHTNNKYNKTQRSKENNKLFDFQHIPSIFAKNKQKIQNKSIQQFKVLQSSPLNQNQINVITPTQIKIPEDCKSTMRLFSKYLQPTYEEEDEYRESCQSIKQHNYQAKQNHNVYNNDNFVSFASLKDFQMGELLGKGAYGTVRVVRHKETGFFFALKTYSLSSVLEKIDRFIETVKLQMYASHPNIAQLYSVFRQDDKIYLLMELCIDGDLSHNTKYLRNKSDQIKKIIKGIVYGLTYLHQKQIIHRDIKLQNIILSHNMPKIIDFDLAVYQKNPLEYRTTFCGSPAYFSPEMLSKYEYNSKVDIWSLGILCYQLICGYYPFAISGSDLMNIVNQKPKRLPLNISQGIKGFIMMMLVKNPQKRADWDAIVNHQYLK